MNRTAAAGLLIVVCMVVAVLLMGGVVGPVIAGLVFAVALALLGVASGGFRQRPAAR